MRRPSLTPLRGRRCAGGRRSPPSALCRADRQRIVYVQRSDRNHDRQFPRQHSHDDVVKTLPAADDHRAVHRPVPAVTRTHICGYTRAGLCRCPSARFPITGSRSRSTQSLTILPGDALRRRQLPARSRRARRATRHFLTNTRRTRRPPCRRRPRRESDVGSAGDLRQQPFRRLLAHTIGRHVDRVHAAGIGRGHQLQRHGRYARIISTVPEPASLGAARLGPGRLRLRSAAAARPRKSGHLVDETAPSGAVSLCSGAVSGQPRRPRRGV